MPDMNAILRRAARRGNTAPTADSVIDDAATVAATLNPAEREQFRDALLDAIEAATTEATNGR